MHALSVPQGDTKEISELLTAVRVLTVNKTEESQGIGTVAQSQTNCGPGTKQSGRFIGQCFWCYGPHVERLQRVTKAFCESLWMWSEGMHCQILSRGKWARETYYTSNYSVGFTPKFASCRC